MKHASKKEIKRKVVAITKQQILKEKKKQEWQKRHPILAFLSRFGYSEMPNGFID